MSANNENNIEEVNVNNEAFNEEKAEPMEKPKKPRTQKQLDSLKLAQEKRRENIAKRKLEKEQIKSNKKLVEKPIPENLETEVEEESEEEAPVIVKKKPKKKKSKK